MLFRILAVLGLLIAGPALARDQLVIGIGSYPTQFHPAINPEAVKSYIEGFAMRPITAYDLNWRNSCLLCTELPSLENGLVKLETTPSGKAGMAVTVKFRPGLFWGDGVKLTSHDLAFTAKVGRDPASGFSNTRIWGKVLAVDTPDDLTAVLHFDEVRTDFDQIGGVLSEHIEGPVFAAAATPGDYIKNTTYNRAPTTPGLWYGPYLITDVGMGSTVVLQPNPYWTGTKPTIRKIVFRTVDNTAALMANLSAGDVDMTPGEGMGLSIDQSIALEKQYPGRFNYIWKPALTYDHIDVQLDNPILSDVRVRRALLHGIDRKAMTARLFDGKLPLADTWLSPLQGNYSADVATYPYDPARARALLAEAGWKPAADGICRNAAGEKLSLEFRVTSGNKLRELMQQVIQSQWKTICVETQIRNDTPRVLFGETLKKRTFQGLVLYSWLFNVEGSQRQILASDQIPTPENNYSGTNYMGWRNAAVDAAILVTETELDRVKRKAAWAVIQKAYAEELPVLPLFFRVEGHALPKWLKGYVPTGHNDYASYWSETWRIEE